MDQDPASDEHGSDAGQEVLPQQSRRHVGIARVLKIVIATALLVGAIFIVPAVWIVIQYLCCWKG